MLPGPDHAYAIEPDELAAMVKSIRAVEVVGGSGIKEPLPEEMELRAFARRTIFVIRDINPGDTLTTENTSVLRCGKRGMGLHPREFPRVLGRRVVRRLESESLLRMEDLE
jgi:sialic acid synthase SpsE